MKHTDPKIEVASAFDATTSKILVRVAWISALVIAATGIYREVWGITHDAERLVDSFSLFGGHQNLTSWYQSLMLGMSALFWLMMASSYDRKTRNQLTPGSAVLFYMAIGEHTNFDHEFSMRLVSAVVPADNAYFASMGLAFVAAASIFLAFRRSVAKIHRYQKTLALGVAVYVSGAIGFECISGFVARTHGSGELYIVACSLEELLEMAGTVVFAIAMVMHLTVRTETRLPPSAL